MEWDSLESHWNTQLSLVPSITFGEESKTGRTAEEISVDNDLYWNLFSSNVRSWIEGFQEFCTPSSEWNWIQEEGGKG